MKTTRQLNLLATPFVCALFLTTTSTTFPAQETSVSGDKTAEAKLVEKVGGPSVRPYQPPGLWKELTGGEDYHPDSGDGLHRRSLYTFWKRTSPPPTMMNFDASGRETCVVRELRTNTPLQSLDLMNDQVYLEAAQGLARRMIREGGDSPSDRISYAFLLAAARPPRAPGATWR